MDWERAKAELDGVVKVLAKKYQQQGKGRDFAGNVYVAKAGRDEVMHSEIDTYGNTTAKSAKKMPRRGWPLRG